MSASFLRMKRANGCPTSTLRGTPSKPGDGQVGFQDQPLLTEGVKADRRQIIKVEIARPRSFQFSLRTAQLLVLQLQFDLVHAQIVDQPLDVFGRQGFQVFRRPGRLFIGFFSTRRRSSAASSGWFFSLFMMHLHPVKGSPTEYPVPIVIREPCCRSYLSRPKRRKPSAYIKFSNST